MLTSFKMIKLLLIVPLFSIGGTVIEEMVASLSAIKDNTLSSATNTGIPIFLVNPLSL